MDATRPTLPAPIVWAEVVARDPEATAAFYSHVFGWRFFGEPGRTDLKVYLDQGRTAGPICGARPRSPVDVAPPGHDIGPGGLPADRWTVRLSPPRPPAAVDPGGDQLLRPRAPGPRIGRFGMPQSLCFF